LLITALKLTITNLIYTQDGTGHGIHFYVAAVQVNAVNKLAIFVIQGCSSRSSGI